MQRLILLVVLMLAPAIARAQSFWAGALSQYITENGVVLHDRPVFQADAFWSLSHGGYVDLWASRSVDGRNSELDYTVGWSSKFADVSVAYFDLEPLWRPNDIVQTKVQFMFPKKVGAHELVGYVALNHMRPRDDPSKNSGDFVRVGLSDTWVLNSGTTIRQHAWLLHDSGVFQGEEGFLARYEAGVRFRRGSYTLEPFIRLSVPFVSDRHTEVVAAVRLLR